MARTERSKYYPRLKLAHQNLNSLFAMHREALTHSRLGAALKYFENYASAQYKHIEEEENSIFPFCREDMKDSGLPKLDSFFKEHRRISEALILLRVLLNKSIKQSGGKIIAPPLDQAEISYMKLVKAHERKEEKYFFPRIEKSIGKKKRPS